MNKKTASIIAVFIIMTSLLISCCDTAHSPEISEQLSTYDTADVLTDSTPASTMEPASESIDVNYNIFTGNGAGAFKYLQVYK